MSYACPEADCSRRFKRREHLSRHRLNHQPRKIHQCHVCHKDFVRLDLLQRHTRRHDRGMAYRKSGGYTTSGRPDSNRHASPVMSVGGLRGQSEITGDAPLRDQLENPEILVDTIEQTSANGLQPMIGESRPSERSDVEYLTFFDGSNDATGLTENLDWLFGIGSWDPSANLDGLNILAPTLELPVWSPTSTTSQGSVLAVGNAHLVPRNKVLSALITLPADVLSSSFFDAASLEWFMQSYWQNYNPHFSLLHRPTFSVQDAPPLLLVALLTLGATLSPDKGHYRVAEKIHESLRWLIFTSPGFQAPAPLWVVQALLVVQSYEKMFSTRKLHEMSHIFHYSVITLMRRGSCYSPDREDDGEISSIEKGWHRWVERELSYRAAYFAFVMDAQHSSIFGHSAALSLTDIHLPLPCADALWDAPTASIWNRERARAAPTPSFLPALGALLARQPVPHTYSPFARFVLLHGLLCLTRHMITRDQTASYLADQQQQASSETDGGGGGGGGRSSATTPEQDSWKDRLDRAIDTWSFSLLSREPSLCLEAARPLQRIAHVSIHVSLVDFHVLAGAPNLATGDRSHRDSVQFARAYKRIDKWAHDRNAKRALSHCLLLIQETMFTRTRYQAAEDNIILKPWVLYNTTLVLWAYGAIRGGADEPVAQGQQWTAEEYLAHMLNGLMGDGDLVQPKGSNRTTGLVVAVRNTLEGCRWELLEEAKETLSRLPEQTSILLSMGSRSTAAESHC